MQIKELSHPKNSNALNESLAKKFGYKLNVDGFTMEQLRAARDKITLELAQFETSKNYDAVYESNTYQRDRALLDVITQAITERTLSPEEEGKKEKYVKGMKKKESEFKKRYGKKGDQVMNATATKMAKKESIEEAMEVLRGVLSEQVITEGEEEKAALIMSARDMVDKITGWLEDTASLKSETMLELVDSIRDELGSDISTQFSGQVKPALEEVYTTLESARTTLAQAVAILTGEEGPAGPAGAPTMGAMPGEEEFPSGDEFAAAEPAAGGEEAAGREMRENIAYSRRLGTILSSKKK
jgi:cobalamin biosynthesis Mg chelatase CobN